MLWFHLSTRKLKPDPENDQPQSLIVGPSAAAWIGSQTCKKIHFNVIKVRLNSCWGGTYAFVQKKLVPIIWKAVAALMVDWLQALIEVEESLSDYAANQIINGSVFGRKHGFIKSNVLLFVFCGVKHRDKHLTLPKDKTTKRRSADY